MRIRGLSAVVMVLSFASGCASIVSGTSREVTIDTTPPGATIEIRGRHSAIIYQGPAPATVDLEGAYGLFEPATYSVTCSLPGWRFLPARVEGDFNPFVIGNVIWLPFWFVGAAVDAGTGALFRVPKRIVIGGFEDSGSK